MWWGNEVHAKETNVQGGKVFSLFRDHSSRLPCSSTASLLGELIQNTKHLFVLGPFMVKEVSSTAILLKRISPYVVPGICGAIIFCDWFHTWQLKTGRKESILDKLLTPEEKKVLEETVKF